MNREVIKAALHNWKLTKYKRINFGISIVSVLIYEILARPYYRPYIYKHNINDFHIADTLGNSLGTFATVFFLAAVFSHEAQKGKVFIILGTISIIVFELLHPLLGKPIDVWDIAASIVTGLLAYGIFGWIFKQK